MCLIVFAYKIVPGSPLILAGNRDEFYQRPAEKAHVWKTKPSVIAGKDKKAGGTWLGLSASGRVAAITNYRDMSSIKTNAPSRGDIVKNALLSPLSTKEYLKKLKKSADDYNGFNLITGTREKLFYFNNITMRISRLDPGLYGISNALLDTPWPKTVWAKGRFREILNSDSRKTNDYFSMLASSKKYPPEKLPETGLSLEMEKAVSSVFIKTEDYGTRCSTVLKLLDNSGFYFEERAYRPGSQTVGSQQVFTRF